MHPKEQIKDDLKVAMKSGDTQRRDILRLLMAAFKQVEVDKQKELSVDDALSVLMSEAKKYRETIEEKEQSGRIEGIEEEQFALTVIEAYLPQQLSREEIEAMARQAIAETGATTPKEMGQVMKVLMPRLKGQADGKLVNTVVRELLG